MKSHLINIHEPSHLSERDSSVSLPVEPGGGVERRKVGEGEAGRVRGCLGSKTASQSHGRYAYPSHSLELDVMRSESTSLNPEHTLLNSITYFNTHTHTQSPTSHISSQVCAAGGDLRGFSPPQCHSGYLAPSPLPCAFLLHSAFDCGDRCQGITLPLVSSWEREP